MIGGCIRPQEQKEENLKELKLLHRTILSCGSANWDRVGIQFLSL